MIYTVENIDGIVKEFTSDQEFLEYAQRIFDENEELDTYLHRPNTIERAENYIHNYCSNLELQAS